MQSTKKKVDREVQAFNRDLLQSVKQLKSGKTARKTRVTLSQKRPKVLADAMK